MKLIAAQKLETTATIDGMQVTTTKWIPPMMVTADGQHYTFTPKPRAFEWLAGACATVIVGVSGALMLIPKSPVMAITYMGVSSLLALFMCGNSYEWVPGPPVGLYRQTVISSDGHTLTVEDATY